MQVDYPVTLPVVEARATRQFVGAVIDDEDSDRRNLARRLEDVGCKVDPVADPRQLSGGTYDIVLVDMVYGGELNGPSFCKQIRQRWPGSLIVAVSAVDEREGLFSEALSEGACASLEKVEVTNRRLREMIALHWCRKHKDF